MFFVCSLLAGVLMAALFSVICPTPSWRDILAGIGIIVISYILGFIAHHVMVEDD